MAAVDPCDVQHPDQGCADVGCTHNCEAWAARNLGHWTDQLPAGSILVIGHPGNGITARREDNRWAFTHNLATVQRDDIEHGTVFTVFDPRNYY